MTNLETGLIIFAFIELIIIFKLFLYGRNLADDYAEMEEKYNNTCELVEKEIQKVSDLRVLNTNINKSLSHNADEHRKYVTESMKNVQSYIAQIEGLTETLKLCEESRDNYSLSVAGYRANYQAEVEKYNNLRIENVKLSENYNLETAVAKELTKKVITLEKSNDLLNQGNFDLLEQVKLGKEELTRFKVQYRDLQENSLNTIADRKKEQLKDVLELRKIIDDLKANYEDSLQMKEDQITKLLTKKDPIKRVILKK